MNILDKITTFFSHLHYRFYYHHYYPVKVWFRNILVFRKELANTYPWDYSGLLLLMRRQIITMEEQQRVYGNHTNAHKIAKDLRVVIKLLDRLIEDDYSVQTEGEYSWIPYKEKGWTEMVCTKRPEAKYIFPKGTSKQLYKHEDNRRKADTDMLMSYLKHYKQWWE